MENNKLLSELSDEEKKNLRSSRIYEEAQSIEKMLLINGAVPGKDYTFLDLFKLAVENLKANELEYIGNGLGSIEYHLEVRNEIESNRK